MPESEINTFLNEWDNDYQAKIKTIDLFKPQLTTLWTQEQQSKFVRIFYHARGHFYKFLWFLANHAPNALYKQLIMENFEEEFGKDKLSHEQLYYNFAAAIDPDINLTDEFINQTNYEKFVIDFNSGHLQWLAGHTWNGRLATFAAYERLDNNDYSHLLNLAESLKLDEHNTIFFKVHSYAEHFDMLYMELVKIWDANALLVKQCFSFIAQHQLKMWTELSNAIFQATKEFSAI